MSIQVGAFRNQGYADALKNKLSVLLNNPVEIILEDGYYKVRVTVFTNKLDIKRILPSLGMMGLRDLWIPPVKVPEPVAVPAIVPPAVVPADTVKTVPVVKPVEEPEE